MFNQFGTETTGLSYRSYAGFFDKHEDSSSARTDEFKNQWSKTLFFKELLKIR